MKKSLVFSILLFFSGFSLAFSQATISGRVFNDLSGNNTYEAGEELNNITVWLFDLNAVAPFYRVSPVQTATTNASGVYTFINVPASDYQVRVKQSTVPVTLTRAISDNDSYANGLTNVMGVSGTNTYSNIDFGFIVTAADPLLTSERNFQFDASNTFINVASKTYNLTPETVGGLPVNPTIKWTTDRTSAPGGAYGTNTYPQAYDPAPILGVGYPGNNKGGIHPGDNTFQLIFGGAGYNPANNDRQTTTIEFNVPVVDVKFSLYDIDHADPQTVSGRIDYVKVTGFNRGTTVLPVLRNPSTAPWNTVSGNTVYGFADYPLTNYIVPYNSQNEDHGTVNVYFQTTIDKIVIEYEEWAPVLLPGKGINDATPPNLATNEASWSFRTAPTTRGVSIGSIDYTVDALTILPLQLKEFSASLKNCAVILNWETTLEEGLANFEIKYSANGRNFQPIGRVSPANNISGSVYRFAVSPDIISGYFRLKINDIDGKFQESEIRSITTNACRNKLTWSLTKNPVKAGSETFIHLNNTNGALNKINVIIRDLTGQQIQQQALQVQTGQNMVGLKTSNLKAGTYIIEIFDEFRSFTSGVKKLIIQ